VGVLDLLENATQHITLPPPIHCGAIHANNWCNHMGHPD